MSKIKLAVLFGGASSEHAISCLSAYSVITNLDREKYDLYMVGITKGGRWLLFEGSPEDVKSGKWELSNVTPAHISPDPKTHGLILEDGKSISLDLVFPVLHGKNGEDGTIQGLLELSQVPYVGCGVAASANCMDKITAKKIFGFAGIPQGAYYAFTLCDLIANREKIISDIELKIGYPVFIKPSRAGSSIGISKAKTRDELDSAINEACLHDDRLLAEKAINAREIEVSVIGNDNPEASFPGEILNESQYYDYNAKYVDNLCGYGIPADLPAEKSEKIREYAAAAYKAADCSGLSRVDFFVDRDTGEIYLNEINTLPGFTDISMFPKLMMHKGYTYPGLIDRLCKLALSKEVEVC